MGPKNAKWALPGFRNFINNMYWPANRRNNFGGTARSGKRRANAVVCVLAEQNYTPRLAFIYTHGSLDLQ